MWYITVYSQDSVAKAMGTETGRIVLRTHTLKDRGL